MALNPIHAVTFFRVHVSAGVLVLGAVVPAVTGDSSPRHGELAREASLR